MQLEMLKRDLFTMWLWHETQKSVPFNSPQCLSVIDSIARVLSTTVFPELEPSVGFSRKGKVCISIQLLWAFNLSHIKLCGIWNPPRNQKEDFFKWAKFLNFDFRTTNLKSVFFLLSLTRKKAKTKWKFLSQKKNTSLKILAFFYFIFSTKFNLCKM